MSTIWVMDESIARFPGDWIIRPATLEDLVKKDKLIIIRSATLEDLPAMLVSEAKTWPEESQRATKEQILSRVKIFPEGQLIAIKKGEVLGILACEIMDYPWDNHIKTFNKRNDNGLIRNHDSMGETVCGMNIGAIPEAPRHVATALIQIGTILTIKMGAKYALASPIIPGYFKYKDEMTAEQYAHVQDKNGKYLDPVINLHAKQGLTLEAVLPDYFHDENSSDYSAIMRWKNPSLPYSFEDRFNHWTGKKENFLIFAVPTGCYWAKKTGGRCTNCGFQFGIDEFWQEAERIDMNLTDFIAIFNRALLHLGNTENIIFYTGGSFFEIPDYLITTLFCRLNKIGQIKEVMFETRPEFVTPENLQKIKKLGRPDLRIKVAIGLESANNQVLQGKINKGFTREDYAQAVKLLKQENFIPCTYVLLKPLGLSEQEAIADAEETIKWSHSVGSELTLLQVAFVQDGTPLAEQYKKGEYRPPRLWSVLEILTKLSQEFPVYLGRFEDYPPPIARPSNCGQCDEATNQVLEIYRQTNKLPKELPQCDCWIAWRKEV
jgi:radical SAM enzyme (TIGR01210 family)